METTHKEQIKSNAWAQTICSRFNLQVKDKYQARLGPHDGADKWRAGMGAELIIHVNGNPCVVWHVKQDLFRESRAYLWNLLTIPGSMQTILWYSSSPKSAKLCHAITKETSKRDAPHRTIKLLCVTVVLGQTNVRAKMRRPTVCEWYHRANRQHERAAGVVTLYAPHVAALSTKKRPRGGTAFLAAATPSDRM